MAHDQRITFARLPAEIRNKIYRLVLTRPGYPIDLWPATISVELLSKGVAPTYEPTCWCRIYNRLCRHFELSGGLALLRTCSWVHLEATPIFYGENTWMFSDFHSWIAAYSWLCKIGPRNRTLIQDLVLGLPEWEITGLGDPSEKELKDYPLDYCEPHHEEYKIAASQAYSATSKPDWRGYVDGLYEALQEAKQLRRIRLVIPPTTLSNLEHLLNWAVPYSELNALKKTCPRLKFEWIVIKVPGNTLAVFCYETHTEKHRSAFERKNAQHAQSDRWNVKYAPFVVQNHVKFIRKPCGVAQFTVRVHFNIRKAPYHKQVRPFKHLHKSISH